MKVGSSTLDRSGRSPDLGTGKRMQAFGIPWQSRWFQLSVLASLVMLLLMLTTGAVGAQAVPPEAKSEQGSDIRNLYFVVFGIGAAVFILVEAMIIFVALRYRRKTPDEFPEQFHGHNGAEIIWTGIPLVIVIALFIGSFFVLDDVTSGPPDGEEVVQVDVVGRQWAWAFAYSQPSGATNQSVISEHPEDQTFTVDDPGPFDRFMTIRVDAEHMRVTEISGDTLTVERAVDGTVTQSHAPGDPIDRLFNGTEIRQEERLGGELSTPVVTVPVGTTVKFNITSTDVIHAFYTPQFLFKIDAMPGRVNTMWVKVTAPGFYESQCAEYCGREHSRMLFSVNALPRAEFDEWLASKAPGGVSSVMDDSADEAAADETNSDETTSDAEATDSAAASRGQELFFANGCNICHGDNGEGGLGPTIASTGLTIDQVVQQYRSPLAAMPAFPEDRISDEQVGDIYAWLQTLPLPANIVPGEGTP